MMDEREAEFQRLQEEHRNCCAGACWADWLEDGPRWVVVICPTSGADYRPFDNEAAVVAEQRRSWEYMRDEGFLDSDLALDSWLRPVLGPPNDFR